MQILSQRKFAVLVLSTIFAFLLPAFGSLSEAQPVSSSGVGKVAARARLAVAEAITPSSAGYKCVSLASLVTAKAGRPGTLAVRLAGFEVTYTGKEAHLATGLFAYPGNITGNRGQPDLDFAPARRPKTFISNWVVCVPSRPPRVPGVLRPTCCLKAIREGRTAVTGQPSTGTRPVATGSWRT